jgi:hypothetical protein
MGGRILEDRPCSPLTEQDWTIVLQVFEVSRSRRGDKGRDDRKVLEALHYFVVQITWRQNRFHTLFQCPNWTGSVRLSRAGTFEAFFDATRTL